jgi:hypothetical protein
MFGEHILAQLFSVAITDQVSHAADCTMDNDFRE